MSFLRTFSAVIIFAFTSFAQNFYSTYYKQSDFNLASPGAMRYGLYGTDNPALLSTVTNPDLLFMWSDGNGWKSFDRWGIFAAVPHIGFSMNREKYNGFAVSDFKLSFGFGNYGFGIGGGYGWSGGDENFFGRLDIFTAGTFFRDRYFSAGLIGNFISGANDEGIIDLAVRPFGNEILSVFGDYVFRESIMSAAAGPFLRSASDEYFPKWSTGIALEPLPGIRITGRYFDNDLFKTGIEYSLGNVGFSTQAHFNKDKYLYNTYGIRIGSYDRNLFGHLRKDDSYVEMDLYGSLKYQRFRFFDNSNTLPGLLDNIKSARNDKTVSGIIINLSGMQVNREMLWELRSELTEFKNSGKKVLVYFDRLNIDGYYLASAADKIIMDPMGNLTLEGYVYGRTYFAGTLEKLGIGYNELRFFKYKSAYETYARNEMSAAEKEQRQKVTDNNYELARRDISLSRGFSSSHFDSLVNNVPYYFPQDALNAGLIDTIARWDKIKEIVNKYEGDNKNFISPSQMSIYKNPRDNYWGDKPKVALIYALGVCAMDEGINARTLVKKLEGALKNSSVKAVVLRVDSPGGDALASDLISEKIREYKYKKPIIISQGSVAASGGYWLSMFGDTIISAPNTLTGSIGVIGAWVYNLGFKEKFGISTDYVKRGEHADLPFGMKVPFIGMTFPDRDLNESEGKKFRERIETMYGDFVNKVSMGRGMNSEKVDSIGQGRVWSGIDALEIGLVDKIGNLNAAIDIAAKKAGLKDGEYEIIELPEPGFFNFSIFMPKIFGLKITEEDPFIENIRFRLKNFGQPMLLMPGEFMGESIVPVITY